MSCFRPLSCHFTAEHLHGQRYGGDRRLKLVGDIIPEAGGTCILADMEWTMEAVMNLLKNCMEHTPSGGTVRCVYEKNPLYTLIRILVSPAPLCT